MGLLLRGLITGPLRDGRLRTIVTIVAVALGVAITLAIDLANASAVASFSNSVNIVASRVNLQILGIGRGFDERTLLRVQSMPGVISADPVIEDNLVVGLRPHDPLSGEVLRVLGVDLLRPLPRDAGDPVVEGEGTGNLLVNGDGAVISRRVADEYHLRVGSKLRGTAGANPASLVVAGIMPPNVVGIDSSVVFVDVATAQDIFHKVGRLDRIDCVIDSSRFAATVAAVRRILPPSVRAVEPATRTGEIARMLQSFQLNLSALSAIALVVGMYLIFNTVAIAVVQRRAEIGMVRAIGAPRRAIFMVFLIEGALLGVFGSLVGLAVGAGLARFSVSAVTRTVQTLYVGVGSGHIVWDPAVFTKAFLIGLVLAIVAAVIPALEASRVPAASAIASRGFERPLANFGRNAAVLGCLVLLVAAALAKGPPLGGLPILGYLSGAAIILGGSLCVPLAIEIVSVAGRRKLHGAPGLLAAVNLGAALRRNSIAVAALAIAIAMVTSVAILVGSFRQTVVTWADEALVADLFVRPLGPADASAEARFSPSVVKTISRVPGVEAVHALRSLTLPYRGRLIELYATDFDGLVAHDSVQILGVADPAALLRRIEGTTNALVSEPFATRFDVRPGDVVALDTPAGPVRFPVAAVFNDYSSDSGIVMIDRPAFVRIFEDDTVNSIAIFARRGANLGALRTRVIRRVLPLRIEIDTNRELRQLVIRIFDRTFAITYALYIISLAIALLGVVSTLFALVLERRREIGILRYLGLSTAGVRKMILIEALLVGALGGISGLAIGILLGLLLIFVINRQAFGWLIELHMPWEFLLGAFLAAVIAAAIAALYPAAVAARIRTAEAVRAE
ncbi:MAG: ABC transporter permease [Vulcanimicrobiaceae bacterium]